MQVQELYLYSCLAEKISMSTGPAYYRVW